MLARSVELNRAIELIGRGTSVGIVGPRWSGRSTFLHALKGELEDSGRDVLRVHGVRGVPELSALRAALPPRSRAELVGAPLSYARLEDALTGHVCDGEHAIVVDDADLLDQPSRALLGSVHQRVGVPIVASALPRASGAAVGGSLTTIVRSIVLLHLEALRVEDLHTLLERRIGESLSPQVTARIHGDSAGCPGLAIAIFDGASASGAVRRIEGVWSGDEVWSPDMRGVCEAYLAPHGPQVRDAADMLAFGGAISLPLATQLFPTSALEELEQAGLLRLVAVDDTHLLMLHPPGLSEHLDRQPLSAHLLRTITTTIDRLAEQGPPLKAEASRVQDRLREHVGQPARVPWRHTPQAVPGEATLGTLFAQGHRLELAAALREWRRSKRVSHAAEVVRLQLSRARDRRTLETVLAETDLTTDVETFDYVEYRYLAARWRISQGCPVEQVVADLQEIGPAVGHRESLGLLGFALLAEFRRLDPEYEQILAPRLADIGYDGCTARVVLAACRTLAGHHDGALDVLRVDREGWPRLLGESAEQIIGLARHGLGGSTAAGAHERAAAPRATAEMSGAAYVSACFVRALTLATGGQLDEARQCLFQVLRSRARAGTLILAPDRAIRVMLVCLSLYTRQDVVSPGLIELVEQIDDAGDALPYSTDGWTDAMELYATGNTEDAARILDAMVASLRERGYGFSADVAELNRLIVRHDPERVRSMPPSARRVGGSAYATLLAGRQAMQDRDPEAMMKAGHRFEEIGAASQAAVCYTNAMGLFRIAGQIDAAADARAAARALHLHDPLPSGAEEDAVRLTNRELEIIGLIARGASNAKIAEQLHLSVRTVETHLRNVRLKTGAEDREALARLNRA